MPMVLNTWTGAYRWEDNPHVQEVPSDSVPRDTRKLAEDALEVAREELALGADLCIRWFGSESETSRRLRQKHGASAVPWVVFEGDGDDRGRTFGSDPSTLWIRDSLDPLDAAEAVLHEAKHSRQYADYVAGKSGCLDMTGASACAERLAEIDARCWVREITAQLEAEAEAYDAEVARVKVRPPFIPVRKSRIVDGHKEFACEHCGAWVRVGVRHRCPAAAIWRAS